MTLDPVEAIHCGRDPNGLSLARMRCEPPPFACAGIWAGFLSRFRQRRPAHDELDALPCPGAAGLDRPPMHLDKAAHHRQDDAEAALAAG